VGVLPAFWPRLGLRWVGGVHVVGFGPRFGLGVWFCRRKFGEMRILAAAAVVFGLQRQHCRVALSVF
jgi:hypothetical protein